MDSGVVLASSPIKGRYRVIATTAACPAAVLYSAEDVTNGRLVTLEILRGEFAADPDFVAAVRDQAYGLAKPECVHRALLRIYECDATPGGDVYVVREAVEGCSLREVIDERGAFDPHSALCIAIQVGEALETLHHSGIVHGELTPESILLVKDEQGSESVKLIGVEFTSARRTAIGLRLRDPLLAPYLAPEQLERGETSEVTDVHALGLLIRELLTAERPDTRPGARRDVPGAVANIVLKALDPLPERRYSNLSVMLNDLWSAQSEPPKHAATSRSVSTRAQTARLPQVRPGVVVTAVAVVVLTGVAGWFVLSHRASVRTAVPDAPVVTVPVTKQPSSPPVASSPVTPAVTTAPVTPPAPPVATVPVDLSRTAPTPPAAVEVTSTPAKPATREPVAERPSLPAAKAPIASVVVPERKPAAATSSIAPDRKSAAAASAVAPERKPTPLVPVVAPDRKPAPAPVEAAPRPRRVEAQNTEPGPAQADQRGSEGGDGSAIIDWLFKDRRPGD